MASRSTAQKKLRAASFGELGVPRVLLSEYIRITYGEEVRPTPSARDEIEGDFREKVRDMLGGFYTRAKKNAFPGEHCEFVIARAGEYSKEAKKAILVRFAFDDKGLRLFLEFLDGEAKTNGGMHGADWALVSHGNHLCVNALKK
jgi:hypothetical protein